MNHNTSNTRTLDIRNNHVIAGIFTVTTIILALAIREEISQLAMLVFLVVMAGSAFYGHSISASSNPVNRHPGEDSTETINLRAENAALAKRLEEEQAVNSILSERPLYAPADD